MAVAFAQPVSHRAGERPLRLTRRGRRVVRGLVWAAGTTALAVVVTVLVLALSSVFAPEAMAGADTPTLPPGSTAVEVVVAPGDTLWELSRIYAPDRDPREVVADIVRINGLDGGTDLAAGARILVPVD